MALFDSCCCSNAGQKATKKKRESIEYLNTLFLRDPERLWPTERVFVPLWKETGLLHAVTRVRADEIPDTPFGDGEKPPGEAVENPEVHHGIFHPYGESMDLSTEPEFRLNKKLI